MLRDALRGRLTAEVTALGKIKIRLPAVLLALVLLFPAQAAAVREVIPIGHTAGIRMKSEGVLVVRLDEVESADGKHCPAREAVCARATSSFPQTGRRSRRTTRFRPCLRRRTAAR